MIIDIKYPALQKGIYEGHCLPIYRESYNFVRNYIYTHKDYTQDLQIIEG
jgi:uncharacterized protein YozE (UPF0346 family)